MLISEYRLDWISHFEKIKQKLAGQLSGLFVAIEHVGSTSVPGLAAKPIIDVDVIYNKISEFENIKNKLEALGYYHNGNQGINGREVFKRNAKIHDTVLDEIAHHLYVCKKDCPELQRHILFRDYLKEHERARIFYAKLKYEIAEEARQDKKRYAEIKEIKAKAFINYCVYLCEEKDRGFEE